MTNPPPVREARIGASAGPGERTAGAVGAAALMVGAFLQAPGKILPETKLSLLLEPGRFLGRALRLWDPSQSFGQIQNQAAGYLLPMGPLYWLGQVVGLPPWVVQRLWIGGLLAVGFWGVVRLARALGIGTPAARVVGGGAYVLGAASLTLVAFRSGTQVPVYALPWIMVPLVEADRHGHRRAAAYSGLAVALMGGINGTATLLVLVVPALWFLTRARAPGRWRLAGWWVAAVVAATAWWVVPLGLQGRYGYAFTGYTESAALTTFVSSATEVLRGTGNWLAYLTSQGHLWLPGGWELVANPVAIIGGLAVAATGLAGLSRHDLPERHWLCLTALLGAVVMAAGYRGALGSPFWSATRSLLDGPAVPLRNIQKFQPLLALPVALGGIHLLGLAQRRVTARLGATAGAGRRRAMAAATALIAAAGLLVAAGGLPFLHGRTGVDGTFAAVPGYWRQAGAWLDSHAGGRRSLVLPASSFGEYTWGRPLDDPLASVTDQPFAVRDIVPLGSNGTTRLLDGIEDQFQSGRLDRGMTAVLRRAGVGYLVVRNDLDPKRTNALPPGQIGSLLAELLGRPVAAFGPLVDARLDSSHLRPTQTPARVRAVEVWSLGTAPARADTYLAAGSLVVSGEPEVLYGLATAGVLGARGALLAGDPEAPTAADLPLATPAITDVSRRRDVTFGDVRFGASYTLAPNEPAPGSTGSPVDRLVVRGGRHLATARLVGAATVRASSYGETDLRRQPGEQPWAAFDGDPSTAWRPSLGTPSTPASPVGAWVQVELDHPRDLRRLTVAVLTGWMRAQPTAITVTTDRGSVTAATGEGSATVDLPPGTTRTVRLTIDQFQGGDEALGAPAISEVSIAGLSLTRPVATGSTRGLPAEPAGDVLLTRSHADPFARDPSPEDSGLDRYVNSSRPARFGVGGTAEPRPGLRLDEMLAGLVKAPADGRSGLRVEASSTWNGQPAFAPVRALDGDPASGWVASAVDPDPTLTLSWDGARTLDSLRVSRLGPPATHVGALVLTSSTGETRTVTVPKLPATTVRFAPMVTDRVTIHLSRNPDGRQVSAATPGGASGLAEVHFDALNDLPAPTLNPDTPFALPCGGGPEVRIGPATVQTQVRGTVADLLAARPVPFQACGSGSVAVGAGHTRITSGIDGALQVQSLHLSRPRPAAPGAGSTRATTVVAWGAEHRQVKVSAGALGLLTLTENANPGWRATLDGKRLETTRVDGWRQAWLVPAGRGGTVSIDFTPGGPYRAALLIGFGLLMVLVGTVALPTRRREKERAGALAPAASLPFPVALGIVLLVGFSVGGWAVLLAVPLLLLPSRDDVLPAVIAAAVVGSAIVVLGAPGGLPQDQAGPFSGAAQGLSVLALLAVAVSLVSGASCADGNHLRRLLPARRWRFPRWRAAPTTPVTSTSLTAGPTEPVTPTSVAGAGSTPSSRRRDDRFRRPRRSGTGPAGTAKPAHRDR